MNLKLIRCLRILVYAWYVKCQNAKKQYIQRKTVDLKVATEQAYIEHLTFTHQCLLRRHLFTSSQSQSLYNAPQAQCTLPHRNNSALEKTE